MPLLLLLFLSHFLSLSLPLLLAIDLSPLFCLSCTLPFSFFPFFFPLSSSPISRFFLSGPLDSFYWYILVAPARSDIPLAAAKAASLFFFFFFLFFVRLQSRSDDHLELSLNLSLPLRLNRKIPSHPLKIMFLPLLLLSIITISPSFFVSIRYLFSFCPSLSLLPFIFMFSLSSPWVPTRFL